MTASRRLICRELRPDVPKNKFFDKLNRSHQWVTPIIYDLLSFLYL